MTDEATLVQHALRGDHRSFERLVAPYRRELHVHCYRMLGSLHDAEDLVQDTLVRAWRGLHTFEQRSSVRAWLYKIATNTCLNELRRRPRIVVPVGYEAEAQPRTVEVPWIQPYPDPDPAETADRRTTTSLAFLTAVQLLSARQRAVLILRDVLAFSTAEVAELLDTSPAAVDSALRRARGRLAADARDQPPLVDRRPDPGEHQLVDRFVEAWDRADVDALVALLAEDAVLAMPPTPAWFRGPAAIGEFLRTVPADGHLDRIALVRTRANGLPALAAFAPEPYGIMVLRVEAGELAELTGFADPSLFPAFDLKPERG